MVSADIGGQAAPLVAAQVVGIPHQASQSAEMVVEQLGQAAAGVPDESGCIGHHPLHREVAQHLHSVEFYIAGGEQISIRDENSVPPPGAGDAWPASQGGTALGQTPGQLVEGAAVDQASSKGGGGGKGGGQTP